MTILLIIIAIVALWLIITAISDKNMQIQRSVIINKPEPEVFNFIKSLKNQDRFSVWAQMDPEMKKEFRGTDGEPGFVYAWESIRNRNVGSGEQEIVNVGDGVMESSLRFLKPMKSTAMARLTTESLEAGQTRVQWSLHSVMKFPMNMMKPLMKKMLGKDIAAGLSNLKSVLEI